MGKWVNLLKHKKMQQLTRIRRKLNIMQTKTSSRPAVRVIRVTSVRARVIFRAPYARNHGKLWKHEFFQKLLTTPHHLPLKRLAPRKSNSKSYTRKQKKGALPKKQ